MKKKNPPDELTSKLEAMPNMRSNARHWTPQQDAAILRFHATKGCPALAKVLELPADAVRKRLAFLKQAIK